MKNISLIGIFALLAGCSNNAFTVQEDAMGGLGGESSTGGNASSSGGSVDGTGGAGVGGTTTGGVGGNDGVGGSDVCVPETCEEIGTRLNGGVEATACGSVTDKCGNSVNCPASCGLQEHCGTNIWDKSSEGTHIFHSLYENNQEFYDYFKYPANNNLCGNECVRLDTYSSGMDAHFCNDGYKALYCAEGVVPDDTNCYAEEFDNDTIWCCESDTAFTYSSY